MRCFYQILLPLTGLFFNRVELTDLWPLKIKVLEYKVLDGDTIKARLGGFHESIRLIPIDAPEMGQPFLTQNGDAGDYSKQCLNRILKDHSLELQWGKRDMYGRLLGELFIQQKSVSKLMVQKGCSFVYLYSRFSSKQEKTSWIQLQRIAQKKRVGLWAYGVMSPYHYRKYKKKGRPFGRPYQKHHSRKN